MVRNQHWFSHLHVIFNTQVDLGQCFFFSYRPSNNSQVLNLFSNNCLINLPSTYRLKIVYGRCCLKVSWGIIIETCKINTSSIGFFKTYLTNPTCDMGTNSFTYLVLIVWGTTMVLIKKRLGSMANIKLFFHYISQNENHNKSKP